MILDEVLKITKKNIIVDGEEVYIIESDMVNKLLQLEHKSMEKKGGILFEMLSKDMSFISNHREFSIIFRPVKFGKIKKWIPCLAYNDKGCWRRVVLQNVNCLKCDWKGISASPTDPDLYITMENRFDILKQVHKLNFCKCPQCGSEISNKGIWVE